jgi:hypothetical protein
MNSWFLQVGSKQNLVTRRCGAKHISKSKCAKPFSDHFWKLRCRKSARRWTGKQIPKSKCKKTAGFGALLDVELRCRKSARRCGAKHISKSKSTNSTTLHYNYDYNYDCATPHYIQQLRLGDHCKHCSPFKKHNSKHLSVHQCIRAAISESQE